MLPFWSTAMENIEESFPKSFQFIQEYFTSDDEMTKRTKQIMDRIRAGRDERLKMTDRILIRGPLSFLILCHHKHGPTFCRALIAVVDDSGHLLPGAVGNKIIVRG